MQSPTPFTFTPTRRTQPYRNNGQRQPGMALQNMMAGQPLHMPNPMDTQRGFQLGGMQPPKEGTLGWHLLRLRGFYS